MELTLVIFVRVFLALVAAAVGLAVTGHYLLSLAALAACAGFRYLFSSSVPLCARMEGGSPMVSMLLHGLIMAPFKRPNLKRAIVIPKIGVVGCAKGEVDVFADFEKVTGFKTASSPQKPSIASAPYWQARGIGFAIMMVSHPLFPFPTLGLVHIRNRIEQRRQVPISSLVQYYAYISGHRQTNKGYEIDFVCEARILDGTPTTDVSDEEPFFTTTLSLVYVSGKKKGPRQEHDSDNDPVCDTTVETNWALPGNTGLEYARVSQDYNPHHLTPLTAMLFGYSKPIAHGMFTLTKSLAEVVEAFPKDYDVDKAFPVCILNEWKRPVSLPGKCIFKAHPVADQDARKPVGMSLPEDEKVASNSKAVSFKVESTKGVPHVVGAIWHP